MMKSSKSEESIDLKEIITEIWSKRRLIMTSVIIAVLLGVVFAFLSPNEFTASTSFIPQSYGQSGVGGGLSGIASLAGVRLGNLNNVDEVSPSLYPRISKSVRFRLEVLEAKIDIEGREVSYKEYYEEIYRSPFISKVKKYTIGLPTTIYMATKGTIESGTINEYDYVKLTEREMEHIDRLDRQILIDPNDKEGFVKIQFTMPDPVASAQMTGFVRDLLQKYLIEHKIKNAQNQLEFTEERLTEKKKEFHDKQRELALFIDRNQGLNSAVAQNRLKNLQAEYDLALGVYSELATQFEQAKLQVAKDTPIFSTIEEVTIPNLKSSPNRPVIVIVFVFFGLVGALGYILTKGPILIFLRSVK